MRLKRILITLLVIIIFIALCRLFFWAAVGCGNDIVCHATEDYPPNCNKNGEMFFLRKNVGMFFEEKSIPDGAFYYLHATWQENTSTYTAVSPIEIANYNNINLEEFVDKAVCIEGEYRFGLPTFFVNEASLPAGMSEYEQVVADIEEIQAVD